MGAYDGNMTLYFVAMECVLSPLDRDSIPVGEFDERLEKFAVMRDNKTRAGGTAASGGIVANPSDLLTLGVSQETILVKELVGLRPVRDPEEVHQMRMEKVRPIADTALVVVHSIYVALPTLLIVYVALLMQSEYTLLAPRSTDASSGAAFLTLDDIVKYPQLFARRAMLPQNVALLIVAATFLLVGLLQLMAYYGRMGQVHALLSGKSTLLFGSKLDGDLRGLSDVRDLLEEGQIQPPVMFEKAYRPAPQKQSTTSQLNSRQVAHARRTIGMWVALVLATMAGVTMIVIHASTPPDQLDDLSLVIAGSIIIFFAVAAGTISVRTRLAEVQTVARQWDRPRLSNIASAIRKRKWGGKDQRVNVHWFEHLVSKTEMVRSAKESQARVQRRNRGHQTIMADSRILQVKLAASGVLALLTLVIAVSAQTMERYVSNYERMNLASPLDLPDAPSLLFAGIVGCGGLFIAVAAFLLWLFVSPACRGTRYYRDLRIVGEHRAEMVQVEELCRRARLALLNGDFTAADHEKNLSTRYKHFRRICHGMAFASGRRPRFARAMLNHETLSDEFFTGTFDTSNTVLFTLIVKLRQAMNADPDDEDAIGAEAGNTPRLRSTSSFRVAATRTSSRNVPNPSPGSEAKLRRFRCTRHGMPWNQFARGLYALLNDNDKRKKQPHDEDSALRKLLHQAFLGGDGQKLVSTRELNRSGGVGRLYAQFDGDSVHRMAERRLVLRRLADGR